MPSKPIEIPFVCVWRREEGGFLISPCISLGTILGSQHWKEDRLGGVTGDAREEKYHLPETLLTRECCQPVLITSLSGPPAAGQEPGSPRQELFSRLSRIHKRSDKDGSFNFLFVLSYYKMELFRVHTSMNFINTRPVHTTTPTTRTHNSSIIPHKKDILLSLYTHTFPYPEPLHTAMRSITRGLTDKEHHVSATKCT